ncbi:transposase domain-containing protein [Pseudomonas fluorescens]|uniref:transposase domain-containing protein n=1 Tax=Pseudomonas fluorescens TaxID=294 RepID=UPI001CD4B0EC|nr:transposase domain-containing protein [Pseudomonas fluorescens]
MIRPAAREPALNFTASLKPPKPNDQEPYAWLRHVLERLPQASSVKDYEALLPWNCSPEMSR